MFPDIGLLRRRNQLGGSGVDRKQRIHELLAEVSHEVLEYIKEIETSYSHRWVPSVDVKMALQLNFDCVPKNNKQFGQKGWLLAILARILEDKGLIEYHKIGNRAFLRSINK